MKTITKLLSTAILATGLLIAPLAQATAHYGAVLFNPLTRHIVRLMGEYHANSNLISEEVELYKNFTKYFDSYSQKSNEIILLEEIGNLKNWYKTKPDAFGKYGGFSLLEKLNLLAFEQEGIVIDQTQFLLKKPKVPIKLVDIRRQIDGFLEAECILKKLVNLHPHTPSWIPNKITETKLYKKIQTQVYCKTLKEAASELKKVDALLLEKVPNYSDKVSDKRFQEALKLYEKRRQLFINGCIKKTLGKEQPKTMYDVLNLKLEDAQKKLDITQLKAFLQTLWFQNIIVETADYGFLGEIALAAEQKKNVFFYSGSAHSKEMANQLNRAGYQTVFLKDLDWTTVLTEKHCKSILNWQPESIGSFPIMDDELSIPLAVKSKL